MVVLGPQPGELVDTTHVVLHLVALRGQGVGYRQAAKLAGLCPSVVLDIRSGRRTLVRADITARLLAVRLILAHGPARHGLAHLAAD
jgi:hypothetical protein